MNNDFTPWLDALSSQANPCRKKAFFAKVFPLIASHGFVLKNPDAIDGGYRLEFVTPTNSNRVQWIIADRYSSFPVAGETPGIHLYDEAHSWEASFTAYTPMHIVIEALNALTADE